MARPPHLRHPLGGGTRRDRRRRADLPRAPRQAARQGSHCRSRRRRRAQSRRDRRFVVREGDAEADHRRAAGMGPRRRGAARPHLRDQVDLHPPARACLADRRRASTARYTFSMRRVVAALAIAALAVSPAFAQSKKTPSKKKTPAKAAAVPPKTATPDTKCPSLIGMGVKTVRSFCDVPAGRDPEQGIVITLPPHAGTGTLTFDLHARHLYSEDEMKSGKAYSRYRAIVGVLTPKGDLLGRGAVEVEFRTASD